MHSEIIKVALVDDDEEFTKAFGNYFNRYAKENGVTFQIETFQHALDIVSEYKACYDVIFLDISMPHLNGMDAAKKIRELDHAVSLVFVTSMAQYAIQGYEVEAVGYLLKPITYYPFSLVMNKIISKVNLMAEAEIVLKSSESSMRRIPLREIYYVEVLGHYLIYHTLHGEYKELGKMNNLEEKLSREGFFRCNYSFLVNLRYVYGVKEDTLTVGEDTISISRRRKKNLLTALNEYMGGNLNVRRT